MTPSRTVHIGAATIDLESGVVTRKDREAPNLGPTALRILVALLNSAGRTMTRAELTSAGWEESRWRSNGLATQVGFLRAAIEPGRGYRYLVLVRGVGYRLVLQPELEPEPITEKAEDSLPDSVALTVTGPAAQALQAAGSARAATTGASIAETINLVIQEALLEYFEKRAEPAEPDGVVNRESCLERVR